MARPRNKLIFKNGVFQTYARLIIKYHLVEAQVRKQVITASELVLREPLKGEKNFSMKRLKQLYSDARGTTRFIYFSIYLLFVVLMFLCINN